MATRKRTQIRDINKVEKKQTSVQRLRNRTAPMPAQREQDIKVIDTTVKALYNEGDRMPLDFKNEILNKHKINLSDKYVERIWDILLSTGLVSPVIGFGNAGKLSLTNDGYQLMNKFGSYSAFLEAVNQEQMQQRQGFQLPQFIIQADDAGDEQEDQTSKTAQKK
jgi:hypothetical protein